MLPGFNVSCLQNQTFSDFMHSNPIYLTRWPSRLRILTQYLEKWTVPVPMPSAGKEVSFFYHPSVRVCVFASFIYTTTKRYLLYMQSLSSTVQDNNDIVVKDQAICHLAPSRLQWSHCLKLSEKKMIVTDITGRRNIRIQNLYTCTTPLDKCRVPLRWTVPDSSTNTNIWNELLFSVYTSLEVKGWWGLLLPQLKYSSDSIIWMCRASFIKCGS